MADKDVGFEIRSADLVIKRAFTSGMKRSGIDEYTSSHGYMLHFLINNSDRDIFQKDIEAAFSIGRSAVALSLNSMEKKGYVRRSSVDTDARLKKITVTDKGRAVHDTITDIIKYTESELVSGISSEELESFSETLAKIRRNAERLDSQPEQIYSKTI